MPLLKSDRDLLDIIPTSISLLSVGVAAWSVFMAADAQKIAREDSKDREGRAQVTRAWDRDASLIEKLTSADPRERRYATLMIQGLVEQKAFTPQLQSTMAALAKGVPSDPVTQEAQRYSLASGATKPPPPATVPAVYVEYGEAGQRCVADFLRQGLQRAGYAQGGVEQTSIVPRQSTIRYFDAASAYQAERVRRFLLDRGVSAVVQNATRETPVPLPQLELRLAPKVYPRVDERGDPIASDASGYLLAEDCKPFIIGVSPLG